MSPAAIQVEDRVQEVKERSPEVESDVSTYVTSDDFSTASEKQSGVRRPSMFSHGAVLPAAMCLSKAAIGAGVLIMPSHAAEAGIVFQTVALLGGAVLTLASIRFIATACIATGCFSYEDLCDELLHPAMAIFTGFMNTVNCIGSGVGYLILCGQLFGVVTGASDPHCKLFVVLTGVFVCAPLATARHVSCMRHLAAGSIAGLLILVACVMWYYAEHGADETIVTPGDLLSSSTATTFTYMASINNVVFAYNNQFIVPKLTGELKPEPTTRRMHTAAVICLIVCFAVYILTSLFGMLAFGIGDHQKHSLVNSLKPVGKNPLVVLTMLGLMLSVLTCFQFHVYPVRQFAAYLVRRIRKREANTEKGDKVIWGRTVTRWCDIFCALFSVAGIIFIAVVVKDLRAVLGFVGSFAAAYIGFIVPPVWLLQVRRRSPSFRWCKAETQLCLLVLSLGIFFFAFGTYTAMSSA
ncbi:slc38a6 [Symbiodinium sp. CCMP2592]|nr:slc38a6 [Symbiodinium sp. CCMP2592]